MLQTYFVLPAVRVTTNKRGVLGLVIRFIGLLHIITTSNYSATAYSHTPQFTTACTKSFQSAVSSLVV
jgi:hypothetical protein